MIELSFRVPLKPIRNPSTLDPTLTFTFQSTFYDFYSIYYGSSTPGLSVENWTLLCIQIMDLSARRRSHIPDQKKIKKKK